MTTTLAATDPMAAVSPVSIGSAVLGFVAFVALVAVLALVGNAVTARRARTRGGIVRTMDPAARRDAARREADRARRARAARRTVIDSEPAGPVRTRHGR